MDFNIPWRGYLVTTLAIWLLLLIRNLLCICPVIPLWLAYWRNICLWLGYWCIVPLWLADWRLIWRCMHLRLLVVICRVIRLLLCLYGLLWINL